MKIVSSVCHKTIVDESGMFSQYFNGFSNTIHIHLFWIFSPAHIYTVVSALYLAMHSGIVEREKHRSWSTYWTKCLVPLVQSRIRCQKWPVTCRRNCVNFFSTARLLSILELIYKIGNCSALNWEFYVSFTRYSLGFLWPIIQAGFITNVLNLHNNVGVC